MAWWHKLRKKAYPQEFEMQRPPPWPATRGARWAFFSVWVLGCLCLSGLNYTIGSEYSHYLQEIEHCTVCALSRDVSDRYRCPEEVLWDMKEQTEEQSNCTHAWVNRWYGWQVSRYPPLALDLTFLLFLMATVLALRAGLARVVLIPRQVASFLAFGGALYAVGFVAVQEVPRVVRVFREAKAAAIIFGPAEVSIIRWWIARRIGYVISAIVAFGCPAVWVWSKLRRGATAGEVEPSE